MVLISTCVAGCSQLIPGLNIRTDSNGSHQYSIVSNQADGKYEVTRSGALPSYEVIPVGPDVLKAVASEQQEGFAYSLPSVLPSDVPPEYVVGPGDILYITVWDHPELSVPSGPLNDISVISGQVNTQTQFVQGKLVASDGSMYFPYVGVFHAAGMTVAGVRDLLSSRLQKVITKPQVDVRVFAFRSARVEVTGEIFKPGTIVLDDTPKGIIQAINQSGGLTGGASRRRALLVRGGNTYQLDLAGLLSGDRPIGNPLLMPGDVLHIPDQSADQVFILGAVGKQQLLPMQQSSMTLIQALTASGGLDAARGNQAGVMIFRMHPGVPDRPAASVYTVSLSNADGLLLASAFDLKPRDIVYVQATAFSQYNSVIAQLLPTVSAIYELAIVNTYLGK